VIAAAAAAAGHSVYLDIYGSQVQAENMSGLEEDGRADKTERRPTDPKLVAKPAPIPVSTERESTSFSG